MRISVSELLSGTLSGKEMAQKCKTGVTPLWPLAMATKSGQIYVELVGATDKNEPKTIR